MTLARRVAQINTTHAHRIVATISTKKHNFHAVLSSRRKTPIYSSPSSGNVTQLSPNSASSTVWLFISPPLVLCGLSLTMSVFMYFDVVCSPSRSRREGPSRSRHHVRCAGVTLTLDPDRYDVCYNHATRSMQYRLCVVSVDGHPANLSNTVHSQILDEFDVEVAKCAIVEDLSLTGETEKLIMRYKKEQFSQLLEQFRKVIHEPPSPRNSRPHNSSRLNPHPRTSNTHANTV